MTFMLLLQAQPTRPGELGSVLMPFILLGLAAWFLLIAPERKKQKAKEAMRASLKSGDRVLLLGGMYGTVTRLEDQTVMVRIADGVQVQFARQAIASIVNAPNQE